MKNLDEKRRLAKLARTFGQPDLELEESIRLEEANIPVLDTLTNILSEKTLPKPKPAETNLRPEKYDLITQSVNALSNPSHFTPQAHPSEKYRQDELTGIRRQIADLVQKMGTMSWGGGGTGVVRFVDLDDHTYPSNVSALLFNIEGPQIHPPDGSISWNPIEECLDVHQPDNTTLQVGLETYIRVYNDTGSPLNEGKFVYFTGVTEGVTRPSDNPSADYFIADETIKPLYTIGVLTETIAAGDFGRVTTLGKVREIDTGMWTVGDLLYASPEIAGDLTNIRPSSPNVAVSVATVLISDNAAGEILVRPTRFPTLHQGAFHSDAIQTVPSANTPVGVTYSDTDFQCRHIRYDANNTSNVIFDERGLYEMNMRLHFKSTNSSRSFIWVWYRINGVDIGHSATTFSIESNGGIINAAWTFTHPMQPGDVFQLMWAADSTEISLNAPPTTAFTPSTPSARLIVKQVDI